MIVFMLWTKSSVSLTFSVWFLLYFFYFSDGLLSSVCLWVWAERVDLPLRLKLNDSSRTWQGKQTDPCVFVVSTVKMQSQGDCFTPLLLIRLFPLFFSSFGLMHFFFLKEEEDAAGVFISPTQSGLSSSLTEAEIWAAAAALHSARKQLFRLFTPLLVPTSGSKSLHPSAERQLSSRWRYLSFSWVGCVTQDPHPPCSPEQDLVCQAACETLALVTRPQCVNMSQRIMWTGSSRPVTMTHGLSWKSEVW